MNSSDKVYVTILKDRMTKIQERKKRLEDKKKSLLSINSIIDREINGLDVEYEKLKKEVDTFTSRIALDDVSENSLSMLDDRYSANEDTIKKYNEEIKKLNDTKSNMQSSHGKKVIDRRIKHINGKIEKLKNKNVKIGKAQRMILFPHYDLMHYRENKINYAEGAVNFNQSRVDDNQRLKDSIGENAWFKSARERYYDIKGMYYMKKLDKSKAHLDKMKNKYSQIRVNGGRVMNLPRRIVNNLRGANPVPSGPTPAPAI